MKISQQQFDILRKIFNNPSATQRQLASELKISLGKLNYVLNALRKKGLIKIDNFQKNKNKSRYLYLLTPKGISEKTNLTIKGDLIKNVYITSTMGVSYKVKLNKNI